MPFAGYSDFADCVSQNQDKDDPDAYCGSIKHQVEKAADNSGRRFIEGWATVDLVDKQGDEILIPGIVESLNNHFNKHHPIIHLEHQSVPVGDMLEVSVRKHKSGADGIWIKAEIYSDYSLHNDVWQAILDKKLAAFSIKGKPLGAKQKCEGGACWRVIPQFELVEVSLVGDPANTASVIESVNWDAKKNSDCTFITDVFKDMVQKSGQVLPTNIFGDINIEKLTEAVLERAGDNSPSAGVGYRKRREDEPGVYGGDDIEKEGAWTGPFQGKRGGRYMISPKGEHEYNPDKWPGQEHGEQAWDRRAGLPATGDPMDPDTGKVRAPEYQDWETPKVQLSPWNKSSIQYHLRRGAQGAKDDVAEYEKMVEQAGDDKEKDYILAIGKKMSELAWDAANKVDGWARTELQEVSSIYSKFASGGKPHYPVDLGARRGMEQAREMEGSPEGGTSFQEARESIREEAHKKFREGKLGKPYEAREEEVDIGTPKTRDHNTAIRAVETIWGKHGTLPGGSFQEIEARIRNKDYEEAKAKLKQYIEDVHATQIPGDPDKTNAQLMEFQRDLGRLGEVLWNLTSTIPSEQARRKGKAEKSYYRKSNCPSCSMVDTIMDDKGSYGASEGQTSLNANVSEATDSAKVKDEDEDD